MKFLRRGILQVIIITSCFSGLLGSLILIIAQINNLIFPADIAIIIVLNILGGIYLNKFTSEKNELILPILSILTLIAAGMLAVSMFFIPNYISFSLPPISINLFSGIDFHPYGFFFFIIVFCLSNSTLLVFKYLARVSNDHISKSSIYALFGFSITFGVFLGGIASLLTLNFGWVYFMPFFGLYLFTFGIIFLNVYLHKQNWFLNILQNPKTIRDFGTKPYYRNYIFRDFFGLFGTIIMVLSTFLIMSASMSPGSTPILLGDMSMNSLNFTFLFSLISFVFYKVFKNIFLMIFPLILGSLFIFLRLRDSISWGSAMIEHSALNNLFLGILLAIGLFSLCTISVERMSENGGSSRLLDLIWLILPFLIGLILHYGFLFTGDNSGSIKDFNSLFGILIYGSIGLMGLQIILRGFDKWIK